MTKSRSPKAARTRRATRHDLEPLGAVSPAAPTQESSPTGGEGEGRHGARAFQRESAALAPIVDELREQWRRRQAWHRAEKSLTLQAKALCRRLAGGDKGEAEKVFKAAFGKGHHDLADAGFAAAFPLIEGRKGIEKHRKAVEKRLAELAGKLPVAPWIEDVRGVGIMSLAAIVGEAGDLAAYSNPAKLWKRMGLAVMPDGARQRKVTGAAGIEHGYSPARRSVVWAFGESVIKHGGAYKEIYNVRKVYETPRVETKGHAHNRAKRYMEKRILRDLWVEWRRRDRPIIG